MQPASPGESSVRLARLQVAVHALLLSIEREIVAALPSDSAPQLPPDSAPRAGAVVLALGNVEELLVDERLVAEATAERIEALRKTIRSLIDGHMAFEQAPDKRAAAKELGAVTARGWADVMRWFDELSSKVRDKDGRWQ